MNTFCFARRFLFAALLMASVVAVSCKKKKAFKQENGQAAVDVQTVQGEEGIVLMDINRVLAAQWQMRGSRVASANLLFNDPCGLITDTTSAGQGVLRMHYDGSSCNDRMREGNITIAIQNYPKYKMKSAGCQVKIDFNGYKVTRQSFGSSVQLDGTLFLTNETGGSWYELLYLNQSQLVEDIVANELLVTINGSGVFQNISRRISYVWADSVMTCTEQGTGIQNGNSNIDSWGFTRTRSQFTSQVITPVVWTTMCGPVFPVSGAVTVQEDTKAFSLKSAYGTDDSGNAVAPGSCAFGFKTTWTYKGSSKNRVFGYDN